MNGNDELICFFPFVAAMLGGIARVLKRVDDISNQQSELADAGLSDLTSLRANARDLATLIEQIERNRLPGEDSTCIRALLSEYGLGSNSALCCTSSGAISQVSAFVAAGLRSRPSGAMLESDLFCLVNRRLRLEAVLSPKEFHEIIISMSSADACSEFELIQLEGWSLVVLRGVFDLSAIYGKLDAYFENAPEKPSIDVPQFKQLMGYDNASLALVVLSRIEKEIGAICRDNGGDFGVTQFYRNLYFR